VESGHDLGETRECVASENADGGEANGHAEEENECVSVVNVYDAVVNAHADGGSETFYRDGCVEAESTGDVPAICVGA
jgi:hypothetical protein